VEPPKQRSAAPADAVTSRLLCCRLEARVEAAIFQGVEDGAIMSIAPSSDPAFSIRMLKAKDALAALRRSVDETLVRWGMGGWHDDCPYRTL
jgi:hypothetical protein